MEAKKMSKEKKELIKKFKAVIDDLMDHYEEYTEAEKAQVKEVFQKVAALNTILDKYDVEAKVHWEEYIALLDQINISMGCWLPLIEETIKYKNHIKQNAERKERSFEEV